jgi:hypothetical protein
VWKKINNNTSKKIDDDTAVVQYSMIERIFMSENKESLTVAK